MLYTEGIRKIFDCNQAPGTHVDECSSLADQAGYSLMSFNGSIYIKVNHKEWIITKLRITDFEVNLNS